MSTAGIDASIDGIVGLDGNAGILMVMMVL